MSQFQTTRTRLFRKKTFRLRHVAIAAIAGGVLLTAGLLISTPDDATEAPVVIAAASEAAAPDTHGLKAAFDKKPATPGYDYAEPRKKTLLSDSIAAVQSGITNLLQAGTDLFEKKVTVGKGDTLMSLLTNNNVPRGEAHEAIAALAKVYDPRALGVGQPVTVFFHQDPAIADPKFSGLMIQKDILNTVTVNRAPDGSYKVAEEERPVRRTLRGYSGVIDNSLYVSARAQGVPDGVILDLIKMYSWNVDFQRDIQGGDRFEVMYEEYVTDAGQSVPGKSTIVYAKLTLSGAEMPYYLFTDKEGDTGYYDDRGQSAKKTLMKTPIDGARLSSGFGMRRHPVLGYSKMHKGVDFAAPRGTPIYAAGDGTIVKIGPFSSYGKYIRIRHRGGLDTAYAHMNGFKAGLKNGSRVKQGQVIGYVGTTGRSTGPHLHYEVLVSGKAVNPNSLKLPTGKSLAKKELSSFRDIVAQVDRQFRALGEGTVISDSKPIKLSEKKG